MLTHKLSELLSSISEEESFGIEDFLDEILSDKNSQAYQLLEFHGLNLDDNELLSVATNLNELVKNHQIDPVINRDKEIDNLKKELEKLKNDKENTQQELSKSNVGLTETTEDNTTTEDKSDNDNVEQPVDTDKNQEEAESSITEGLEQENNEVHNIEDEGSIIDNNEKRLKPSHFINLD